MLLLINGRSAGTGSSLLMRWRMAMVVRVALLIVSTIFLAGSHAFAQERGGFTVLVDLGVGVQNDTTIDRTQAGLAGLNVGVGGFLTRDFALMFRIAGTTVSYDLGALGYHTQLS